jgi:hypothetical protein
MVTIHDGTFGRLGLQVDAAASTRCQVFDSHQGRGLGGSSVIKFSNWLMGDKNNYNKRAEIVGDPD